LARGDGPPSRAGLMKIFKEIDADGGGTLDREEVRKLALKLGAALSEQDLDDAMVQVGRTVSCSVGQCR
jgi:Ca2+-binding EF-hand superfamily protein